MAEHELLDGPAGLVMRILEMRAYKQKLDQIVNPDPKREVAFDELYELVTEIHQEVVEESKGKET